jgi:hypothetical protein
LIEKSGPCNCDCQSAVTCSHSRLLSQFSAIVWRPRPP